MTCPRCGGYGEPHCPTVRTCPWRLCIRPSCPVVVWHIRTSNTIPL